MEKQTYIFGGATVTIVDKSSHAERTKRLRKPLEAFYLNILKEEKKHEENNKKKTPSVGRSNT